MQVTYPGVYVREVPSGVRTVTGVSTSVALFVGESIRGPLERPTRVTSYTELVRRFGESHTHGELSRQVRQFFLNGGREAWVVRIGRVATEPAYASVTLQTVLGASALRLVARDAGLVHADLVDELAHRALAVAHRVEKAAPGGLGDHVEDRGDCGHAVTIRPHAYMHNRMDVRSIGRASEERPDRRRNEPPRPGGRSISLD